MRIAVVGSRGFYDYHLFKMVMDAYCEEQGCVTELVSGGCRNSADEMAERYAREKGLKMTVFKPDWNKHGKAAGFIRNKDIIQNSEKVVAFWNGASKGTKHSIDLAKKYNKETLEVRYDELDIGSKL
jgi:hypothetical protein